MEQEDKPMRVKVHLGLRSQYSSALLLFLWSSTSGHHLLPWVVGLQHERTPSIRAGTRQLDTWPLGGEKI